MVAGKPLPKAALSYLCPAPKGPITLLPMDEKPGLEPEDFYWSPEGYRVFTERFLLKRGYCCQSGCRHCPYGFDVKTGLKT